MSVAGRARRAVVERLRAIRAVDGYYTDMGLAVIAGRTSLGPADLAVTPVVAVYTPAEEFIDLSGDQHRIGLTITVEAFAVYDQDADTVADDLLSDLKTALLRAEQPALADATGPIGQRLEYVSAGIDLPDPGERLVMVTVTLRCRYFERYGAPALIN